jgi:hypothetical protein
VFLRCLCDCPGQEGSKDRRIMRIDAAVVEKSRIKCGRMM